MKGFSETIIIPHILYFLRNHPYSLPAKVQNIARHGWIRICCVTQMTFECFPETIRSACCLRYRSNHSYQQLQSRRLYRVGLRENGFTSHLYHVHKCTISCPVFVFNNTGQRDDHEFSKCKKPDILRHPVLNIVRGDRIQV